MIDKCIFIYTVILLPFMICAMPSRIIVEFNDTVRRLQIVKTVLVGLSIIIVVVFTRCNLKLMLYVTYILTLVSYIYDFIIVSQHNQSGDDKNIKILYSSVAVLSSIVVYFCYKDIRVTVVSIIMLILM